MASVLASELGDTGLSAPKVPWASTLCARVSQALAGANPESAMARSSEMPPQRSVSGEIWPSTGLSSQLGSPTCARAPAGQAKATGKRLVAISVTAPLHWEGAAEVSPYVQAREKYVGATAGMGPAPPGTTS